MRGRLGREIRTRLEASDSQKTSGAERRCRCGDKSARSGATNMSQTYIHHLHVVPLTPTRATLSRRCDGLRLLHAGWPHPGEEARGDLRHPFFAAAAESDAPSAKTLIDQLASEANVRNLGVGAGLDDVPFGTFVIVVSGELIHTEKRVARAKRMSMAVVSVESKAAEDDAMATRKPGDIFRLAGLGLGTSGKLQKMVTDLSRIVAVQKSQLLLLSPEELGRVVASAKAAGPDEGGFVAVLEEMYKQDIKELLTKIPLFKPLNPRVRSTLAQLFTFEIVPPGSKLFAEGEFGENFCILLHGELGIYAGGKRLVTRAPPAFLGEIALLYNCERTATVQCDEKVSSVLTLRAEHFQKMLDRVPGLRADIEEMQCSRMIYSFMIFSGCFDKAVDTEETTSELCRKVAKLITVKSVKEGEVLAEKDKPNSSLLMLYQGKLKRTRHDSGSSAGSQVLSPGGYAGGVSMLRLDGTIEEVVAETPCLILVADGYARLHASPPRSLSTLLTPCLRSLFAGRIYTTFSSSCPPCAPSSCSRPSKKPRRSTPSSTTRRHSTAFTPSAKESMRRRTPTFGRRRACT